MNKKKSKTTKKKAWLLGLGLDNKDGHTRITSGQNFRLIGGSEETHNVMQEKAVKLNEQLKRRGKTLDSVTVKNSTRLPTRSACLFWMRNSCASGTKFCGFLPLLLLASSFLQYVFRRLLGRIFNSLRYFATVRRAMGMPCSLRMATIS